MTKSNIVEKTTKSVKRNKWLSTSTVVITTISILLSSFFISLAIIARKGIEYYESQAQVIVFFKRDAKEEDILAFKKKIDDPTLIDNIEYISQIDALNNYKKDFADNPDLLSAVTADSLPPSLQIRAKSVTALLTVIEGINKEKSVNADIDQVMYFKDVVGTLEKISRYINIGSIILITALAVVTFFLIRITIGFNISSHAQEIRIMDLVGSSEKYIKTPFIMEGLYYGLLGSIISASLIIIPWYVMLYLLRDSVFGFWVNGLLNGLSLVYLKPVNIVFLLIYYLVHALLGGLIGVISSVSAVKKYLK